jgi:DNA-binding response OmpR family regulator
MIEACARCRDLAIENEILQERITQLLPNPLHAINAQSVFGLKKAEAFLFMAMMQARHAASIDYLLACCEAVQNGVYEASKDSIDVHVCRMRRVLRPFGIKIVTIHGSGYELPPASKARARELMG